MLDQLPTFAVEVLILRRFLAAGCGALCIGVLFPSEQLVPVAAPGDDPSPTFNIIPLRQ